MGVTVLNDNTSFYDRTKRTTWNEEVAKDPALWGRARVTAYNKIPIVGHSYVDPSSTPGQQVDQFSLAAQLQHYMGVADIASYTYDLGVSGSQIAVSSDTGGNTAVMQALKGVYATLTGTLTWPYLSPWGGAFMYWGINDAILASGDTARTANIYTAFPHAFRSMVSFFQSAVFYDYADAAWTYSGGTNVAATGVARGAGYRNYTVDGSYQTMTIPSDFAGGVIQVWTNGRTVGSGGTVTVNIDSEDVDEFTTLSQGLAGTAVSMCRRLHVPSDYAGTTLKLTASDITGAVQVQGMAIESDTWVPISVANINRWLSYTGGWQTITDEVVRLFNEDLKSVVEEFPSSVQIADVDTTINKNADLMATDGGHLNAYGVQKVAQTMYNAYLDGLAQAAYHGKVGPIY